MSGVKPLSQTLNMKQGNMFLVEPVTVGKLSPIDIRVAAPDDGDRQDMIDKGLTDKEGKIVEQWRTAGTILANPAILIKVAIASSSGLRLLYGYLHPDVSGYALGFTPAQNNLYNLTWPLRKDHILSMFVSGLGLDENISEQGISETLSVDALVAMAGFADAIRGIELSNMLARVTNKPEGTDVDQVILSINEGLFTEDRRWASTLLRDLLPEMPDPKEEKICNALNELVAIGWLREKRENYWVMTALGRSVFTHWQMVMASAIFNVTESTLEELREKQYLGIIRTIASLWTVQQVSAGEKDRKMMRIEMVSSVDLLNLLQKQLGDVFTAKKRGGDDRSDTIASCCPLCGAITVPGARFCSKCGGEL